jgi:hypothetical protein
VTTPAAGAAPSSNGASSKEASSNAASSFGASSFGAVLAAVRQGQTVGAAARSLGLSPGLAEAMLDEARRLGLAVSAREVCGTCSPASATALCAGCPVLTRDEV